MSKRGRWIKTAMGIVLAWQVLSSWGDGLIQAEPPHQESRTDYQYVGVQQTIARIDATTGRIEILSKRGEPRASLLTPDMGGWEWRRVLIREGASQPPSGGGRLDERPNPDGAEEPATKPRDEGESAGL